MLLKLYVALKKYIHIFSLRVLKITRENKIILNVNSIFGIKKYLVL